MCSQLHIHQNSKSSQKTHSQWFEVLTWDRFPDSNVSEHFCLYFCSTAKWDILKATGWWAECMGMSVHIHLWYQPCPHSVTITVVKPFRLGQAAICPEEKSLHGQRYGLEVGMFSFCLSLSCRHPPTAQQLLHSFSSRCTSSQHLPIGSISNDPVTLDKITFAFSVFGKTTQGGNIITHFHAQIFGDAVPFILKHFFTADIEEISIFKLTISF